MTTIEKFRNHVVMDNVNQFQERIPEVPFSQKDHISKVATLAEGLGLSYGQYQARIYEAEQRRKAEAER